MGRLKLPVPGVLTARVGDTTSWAHPAPKDTLLLTATCWHGYNKQEGASWGSLVLR